MPIKTETFSLDTVLGNVAGMLESQAEKKDVRLGLTIGPDVPDLVHGSRSSLEAIIINLASNAVKFTAEGHVNILVRLIEEKHGIARIRCEVADTGIGIAKEAQETVFEAFSQADDTILDRFGGTGLGLATAKQLAVAQNGAIGVESEPGQGTTFWFELPLEIRPTETGNARQNTRSAILISRNAGIVRSAGETLAALNAVTRIAENVAAAVRLLESLPADGGGKPVCLIDWETWRSAEELDRTQLHSIGAPAVLVDSQGMSCLKAIADRNSFVSHVAPDADVATLARVLALAGHVRPVAGETEEAESRIAKARTALKVLVADDNKTNRMVVTKILEMAGHETLEAGNGEEMLDTLAETGCDVVLMDVNMPVMNGIEATKHLRVMEAGQKDTPVIGLTADGSEEMRRACTEAGMNGCLTKPVNPPRSSACHRRCGRYLRDFDCNGRACRGARQAGKRRLAGSIGLGCRCRCHRRSRQAGRGGLCQRGRQFLHRRGACHDRSYRHGVGSRRLGRISRPGACPSRVRHPMSARSVWRACANAHACFPNPQRPAIGRHLSPRSSRHWRAPSRRNRFPNLSIPAQ